jgi:2-amino-4-hydroxy-6-hydroxymethyldihydropteridine diphosphokinase
MSETGRTQERYLIALGSNMRHHRFGSPRKVIGAALAALAGHGIAVERASRVIETAPLGPSRRRYANAVALVATPIAPHELLAQLKRIETAFGRRGRGQRWGARVLDLDIVLWSGGPWSSPGLVIPHLLFRKRNFVLEPAVQIAGSWRDPLSGFSLRHLRARLARS